MDRALDRLHRARVERLHGEHPRLGHVDRRQLLDRRPLAVVVDDDPVEQRGRRAARAHRVELVLRSASTDLSMRRFASSSSSSIMRALPGVEMIVPIRSPATTRSMLPLVVEAEDVDRQAVVHAERERRRVHHLQAALDRLHVRQLGEEARRPGRAADRRRRRRRRRSCPSGSRRRRSRARAAPPPCRS